MKIISKFAEHVGCVFFHGERFDEWRCPNKDCGWDVSEDYICCPLCGQKLKFKKIQEDGRIMVWKRRNRRLLEKICGVRRD